MSHDKYLFESSFSSWSELNTGNSLDSNSIASLSTNGINQNFDYLINNNNNNFFQNLITLELERPNNHVGFGFDLKGDRPAVIGSVRKGSVAEKVGLREGDLVISINNKKVTDLDHDQVVRHIGLTKYKLLLQIAKIRYDKLSSNNNIDADNKEDNSIKNKNDENKPRKKNTNPCSKIKNQSTKIQQSKVKLVQSQSSNKLLYQKNNNTIDSLNNNTKTTEDDEEESDIDYDFFLMTGRRRQRRHHHHHHHHHHNNHFGHHRQSKKCQHRNNVAKKSPTLKKQSNSSHQLFNSENINFENIDEYEETEDTGDTEDTEDTEDNSNSLHKKKNSSKNSSKQRLILHKKYQYFNKQMLRSRNSHSHDSSILSNSLNKKKIKLKAKIFQSPKSISSSRHSNSEINESSLINPKDEFSTTGHEKETINMVKISQQKIQPKKSKIVQTNGKAVKSKLIITENDENFEKYEFILGKTNQKISSEKVKNKERFSFQPIKINQQKQSTLLNSNTNNINIIKSDQISIENLNDIIINNGYEDYSSYPVINPNIKLEQHDIIPVSIKNNSNEKFKIANIKHFSKMSTSNYENDNLLMNSKSNNVLKRVDSTSIKCLNVNDLYAILKPIIKPHIYNNYTHQNCKQDFFFTALYLGQCIVPYDTLSNASKLASIRYQIEHFTVKSSSETNIMIDEQSLLFSKSFPSKTECFSSSNLINDKIFVNFIINHDLLKIDLKTNDGHDELKNYKNTFYLTKLDIGFCGKIKNSNEFFAIVMLPNMSSHEKINNISRCLLFKYLDSLNQQAVSIEVVLNEISKIYRDKDSVFNTVCENNINLFDMMTNSISPNKMSIEDYIYYSKAENYKSINNNSYNNMVSNLNYEFIHENSSFDDENIESMETSDNSLKKSINKENLPSRCKKIKNNLLNNNSKSNLSNNSSHNSLNNNPEKKTMKNPNINDKNYQQQSQYNHSNGMKLIKENFTNLFLSKKSISGSSEMSLGNSKAKKPISFSYNGNRNQNQLIKNQDDEILKTIELETNKNSIKSSSTHSSPTLKYKSNTLETRDSSILSSNTNTLPQTVGTSKFSFNSLNTRLSLKFTHSSSSSSTNTTASANKLKKVSNQFQFLKSKPPIHLTDNKLNNKEVIKDFKEEFYDADQVLNLIESKENNSIDNKQLKNNPSSSRLSYPLISLSASQSIDKQLPNKSTTAKTNAKKLFFNFISGSTGSQDDNNIGILKSKAGKVSHLLNHQNRRLSDYHQPIMKSLNITNEQNDNKRASITNSLTDVSNQDVNKATNETNNEIGRVAKWAIGFEKLLEDPIGLQIFTIFLKKEFSEENIDFWVECEKYKKISNLDEMKKEASRIWNLYLCSSSLSPVNVDSKARTHCKDQLENPTNTMFEMAQTQIFTLMRYDSYSRFLKSSMYKDCIVNEMEGKSITLYNSSDEKSKFDSNLNQKVSGSNSSNNFLNGNKLDNEEKNKINQLNKKDKDRKKNTLLPWNKGSKEKKISNSVNQVNECPKNGMKNLIVSSQLSNSINELNTTNKSINLENPNLNIQIENKLCKAYYNDGSSTMIMVIPEQTCHQVLNKILEKKKLTWYKCNIYFLDDNQPINPHCDSKILSSKEICIDECSIFILSLIPISINLCIRGSKKKHIHNVLLPIFDYYQIKSSDCIVYLNSTNSQLNLNELCSIIDNQNLLVVHKHQSNMLSLIEIDKYLNISLQDFLPSDNQETNIQFDQIGIMKQVTHNPNNNISFLKTDKAFFDLSHESVTNRKPKLSFRSQNEEHGDKNFIDLLSKAQTYSLNDQRGKIDSKNLEIPNFLLTNNLAKNQSLSQSLISNQSISSSHNKYFKINDENSHSSKSLLLPIKSSTSLNSLPIINYQSVSGFNSKTINQNYMCSSRSRSPIMIVYDYEDLEGITSVLNNEDNKNYNFGPENSNKLLSPLSNLNQSYSNNNQYNNNSNIKANRTINSHNSTKLDDIDEYGIHYTSKQTKTSATSLNNSQISYV